MAVIAMKPQEHLLLMAFSDAVNDSLYEQAKDIDTQLCSIDLTPRAKKKHDKIRKRMESNPNFLQRNPMVMNALHYVFGATSIVFCSYVLLF